MAAGKCLSLSLSLTMFMCHLLSLPLSVSLYLCRFVFMSLSIPLYPSVKTGKVKEIFVGPTEGQLGGVNIIGMVRHCTEKSIDDREKVCVQDCARIVNGMCESCSVPSNKCIPRITDHA